MKRFKMRAEARCDVGNFLLYFEGRIDNLTMKGLFDMEVEFDSDKSLKFIKNSLDNLRDCHVMSQTVQPIEKYTGERF